MKIKLFVITFLSTIVLHSQSIQKQEDSDMIKAIHEHALTYGKSYDWLTHITKNIGARLTGSPELDEMVSYTKHEMEKLGLDSVWLEPVMAPKWTRGEKEEAYILSKNNKIEVDILALGGSIATPNTGIQAEVIEVNSLEEITKLGKEKVSGKIVFFNRPMNPNLINTFNAYGEAADQRFAGPRVAAEYGAVGAIVRSMTLRQDDVIHTGSTGYGDLLPEQYIPAATISTNTANRLSALLKEEEKVSFFFKQNCEIHDAVLTYNVIGEIRGKTHPNEILLVGGHLDSWDVGEGAHDDGAGIVQSMEVMEIFKSMNYTPNRTIRAVLFANEENGLMGGRTYAENVKKNSEYHLFAIESDSGGYVPRGFSFDTEVPEKTIEKLRSWLPLFAVYNLHVFDLNGYGADISPLKDGNKTLLGSLYPDSQRYFDIHHSEEDTLDKVNPRELQLGSAAMASLLYMIDKYGL